MIAMVARVFMLVISHHALVHVILKTFSTDTEGNIANDISILYALFRLVCKCDDGVNIHFVCLHATSSLE